MDLKARLSRLERIHAPPPAPHLILNPGDEERFQDMFEQIERLNGPPPRNPDGTLSRDLDAVAAWLDAVPS
jgi:hypothetical protein